MRSLLNKEHFLLKQQAILVDPAEFKSAWLKKLVIEMIEIMKEKGAVGVAAPQIGVSKRVIVYSTQYTKRRKPEISIPDTILINPSIMMRSDEQQLDYEGCLNCEELMGQVPRAKEIEYSGFDLNGCFKKKKAEGLEARILQHEVDHLEGILFLDHITNKESITTYSELQERLRTS